MYVVGSSCPGVPMIFNGRTRHIAWALGQSLDGTDINDFMTNYYDHMLLSAKSLPELSGSQFPENLILADNTSIGWFIDKNLTINQ